MLDWILILRKNIYLSIIFKSIEPWACLNLFFLHIDLELSRQVYQRIFEYWFIFVCVVAAAARLLPFKSLLLFYRFRLRFLIVTALDKHQNSAIINLNIEILLFIRTCTMWSHLIAQHFFSFLLRKWICVNKHTNAYSTFDFIYLKV